MFDINYENIYIIDIVDIFNVDENTGEISVYVKLDREQTDIYEFNVRAEDNGEIPRTAYSVIHITVGDQNDNDPLFYDNHDVVNSSKAVVLEKSPVGTLVSIVYAKDVDQGENGEVGYSLKLTKFSDLFAVDLNTGQLAVNTLIDVNRLIGDGRMSKNDTKRYFEITVEATDHGTPPRNSTLDILVSLDKLNDETPDFTEPFYSYTVPENSTIGKPV